MNEKLQIAIKEAMKEKDTLRLDVLRGVKAAITNELVATGKTPQETLSDEEVTKVIMRLAKQRKDSIEQFRRGGREDLVEREEAELKCLEPFLPQLMSKEEVERIANEKKEELGISSKEDSGKLMAALMKDLRGKADGQVVKEVVDSILS